MNIFSYESKFNQIMMTLADLIILNILYLVCCIPIFTISAAQAGLFTGIRVLLDKEDDSSVAKAFFRGFSDGFGKSAVAGSILLVALLLMLYIFANVLALYLAGNSLLPVILCGIAVVFIYMAHSILGPFHASFGCTVGQLIRNAFMVAFAYPLRSLAVALLTVLPLVVFLIWPHIFIGGIIAFLAMYYSAAYLLCTSLLKKPFDRLKNSFNQAHGIGTDDEDETEEEDDEVSGEGSDDEE